MEERITVRELAELLIEETRKGNGDCFIQVSEYMLPKDFMVHRDETGVWEPTLSCDGIHYSDIENTPGQEEQIKNNVEKYWEEHPEEKKAWEDMNFININKSDPLDNSFREKTSTEENIKALTKYVEYVADNLDNSIKYSEYLGEKISNLADAILLLVPYSSIELREQIENILKKPF